MILSKSIYKIDMKGEKIILILLRRIKEVN